MGVYDALAKRAGYSVTEFEEMVAQYASELTSVDPTDGRSYDAFLGRLGAHGYNTPVFVDALQRTPGVNHSLLTGVVGAEPLPLGCYHDAQGSDSQQG